MVHIYAHFGMLKMMCWNWHGTCHFSLFLSFFSLLLRHVLRIYMNAFVLLMLRNNDSILLRIRLMTRARIRFRSSLCATHQLIRAHVNAMIQFRLCTVSPVQKQTGAHQRKWEKIKKVDDNNNDGDAAAVAYDWEKKFEYRIQQRITSTNHSNTFVTCNL